MPGNFISRLFRRESADKIDSADLRGPLDLGPGDQVRYYRREFEVAGVVALHQKGCVRRFRYHLVSGEGERLVLSATADPELRLSLQRSVEPERIPDPTDEVITLQGRELSLADEGIAQAETVGVLHSNVTGTVSFREYEDEDQEACVVLEGIEGIVTARIGETLFESEIETHRLGEVNYELKALPRVDRKSLNEARYLRGRDEDTVARGAFVESDPD